MSTGRPVRAWARDALSLTAVVLTAPLWLAARLQARLTGGETVFASCSELLSLVPGLPGVVLRRGFYWMTLEACPLDCTIGFGTTLPHPQVRIGRCVYISNRCTIGRAVIADHAAIGSNVDLLSGRRQHNHADPDALIMKQSGRFDAVYIGRNTWIGNSSVIMADVGDQCVLGAGSVVVKPIPPRCVAAGNPAVVKKQRGPVPEARGPVPAPAPGEEACCTS
jgi:acetyltransferase-like isoleucine patch superfamily enzyme